MQAMTCLASNSSHSLSLQELLPPSPPTELLGPCEAAPEASFSVEMKPLSLKRAFSYPFSLNCTDTSNSVFPELVPMVLNVGPGAAAAPERPSTY